VRLAIAIPVIVVLVLIRQHGSPSKGQQALSHWADAYGIPVTKVLQPLLAQLGNGLTTLAGEPMNTHLLRAIHRDCIEGQREFKVMGTEPLPPNATLGKTYAEVRRTGTAMFSTCLVIFPGTVLNQSRPALALFNRDISGLDTEMQTLASQATAVGITFSN